MLVRLGSGIIYVIMVAKEIKKDVSIAVADSEWRYIETKANHGLWRLMKAATVFSNHNESPNSVDLPEFDVPKFSSCLGLRLAAVLYRKC